MRFLRRWGIVIALLLLHFWLRTTDILSQDPYLDEGFHLSRASFIWTYDENPGYYAGKLLAYYYYGLFETHPTDMLFTGRMAMAILSLLTAACVYTIARVLVNRHVGWLALWLYAIMPFAFYFERLAFADPIASVCVALLVWRSIAFAKHPAWWQGLIIGVLLFGATAAKLSMGLVAIIPVAATVLMTDWRGIRTWMRTYLPALLIAAGVVIAIWTPFTVPLYLSDPDYTITNPESYTRPDPNDPQGPREYLERTWPSIEDYGGEAFFQAAVLAGAIVLVLGRNRRLGMLMVLWVASMTLLNIGYATLTVARYFMPMAAPIAVLMAAAIGRLLAVRPAPLRLAGVVALLALGYWAIDVALPFHRTAIEDTNQLDFSANNWVQYQSGQLSADDTVREAATTINDERDANEPVFATWTICHLLFFYVEDGVTCIPDGNVMADLTTATQRDLAAGGDGYMVIMAYPDFVEWLDHLETEKLIVHRRPSGYRPISIWRIALAD